MFASFWVKFTYLCFWQVYGVDHHSYLGIWLFGMGHLASILLMINFVITLLPATRCSTATLAMSWRNLLPIRGQTHKKTDVSLLNAKNDQLLHCKYAMHDACKKEILEYSQRRKRRLKDGLKRNFNQIFKYMYLLRRKLNPLHQSPVKTFLRDSDIQIRFPFRLQLLVYYLCLRRDSLNICLISISNDQAFLNIDTKK